MACIKGGTCISLGQVALHATREQQGRRQTCRDLSNLSNSIIEQGGRFGMRHKVQKVLFSWVVDEREGVAAVTFMDSGRRDARTEGSRHPARVFP